MTKKNPKIVVVMPAYNASRTIKDTFKEIPAKFRKHIILVDDHSKDNTIEVAEKLGIKTFSHPTNLGYGGNQKTCYWEALKLDPDVVVMLHPDYQYDATMMSYLVQPILDGKYDYMFGSRIASKKGALEGGMPLIKYVVNRIVCFIQNILLGVNFSEHFSGYRAYSKKLLETIPFQKFSNDFGFDQEMTISAISYQMRIGEISIPTRYHEKQSSIKFLKGTKFVLDGFLTIFKYILHQASVIKDSRFASVNIVKTENIKFILVTIILVLITVLLKQISGIGFWVKLFIFISSLVYYFLTLVPVKKKRLVIIFYLLTILLMGVFVFSRGIYKDTFYVSGYEKNLLWTRKELYRRELGYVGRNTFLSSNLENFKFYRDKITRKISHPYDLSRYFSINKPSYYYFIFFPIALIGLVVLFSNNIFLIGFSLFSASTFSIFVQPNDAYVLFIPIINIAILLGFKSIMNFFIKNKK